MEVEDLCIVIEHHGGFTKLQQRIHNRFYPCKLNPDNTKTGIQHKTHDELITNLKEADENASRVQRKNYFLR